MLCVNVVSTQNAKKATQDVVHPYKLLEFLSVVLEYYERAIFLNTIFSANMIKYDT